MKLKNILVSQPQPAEIEKSPYSALARKHGMKVTYEKFIRVEGLSSREFRQQRINLLDFTGVIMTSRKSVDHYFRLAKLLRVEVPDSMKYFCISESTAFYLQKYVQYRKRKIFHGNQSVQDLFEILGKNKSEKLLLPCSEDSRQELGDMLEAADYDFKRAVMYRTVPNDLSHLDMNGFDLLIFFSPWGVKSLFTNFPDFKQQDTLIAAFGTNTADEIRSSGMELNIAAPTKKSPSMTMAIEEFIAQSKKK